MAHFRIILVKNKRFPESNLKVTLAENITDELFPSPLQTETIRASAFHNTFAKTNTQN